jgi:hypothetical protein
MVSSGNQTSNGWVDFYNVYKAMVETELARPPQAEIQAYWWREGNKVGFYVQVTNLGEVTLSQATNQATVHAIVYEDAKVGVTNRFVRAAVSTGVSYLPPNATATFTLETPDLLGIDFGGHFLTYERIAIRDLHVGVNWDNLHFVALVDYRPSGSVGAYDMLQAAVCSPIAAPFAVQPDMFTFMVDPSDLFGPKARVNFQGPGFVNWTATTDVSWLVVTPSFGPVTQKPTISVIKEDLSTGWQHGNVTFTTTDGFFQDQVKISVYYGEIERVYLPIVLCDQ